jgi:anhydro-N-acetylmuramic acid kinase
MRVIGLMSGTSLDGVDAALVSFAGDDVATLDWSLEAFVAVPYSPAQRSRIHEVILTGTPAELCRLHVDLGEWFADAALAVCRAGGLEPGQVDVIGSHGQTIWHEPRERGRRAASLQLGCPATIAERTGIPVVSDFRARDAAAGGEGAPLVPWVDRLLFSADHPRVLQNIGGMANLTWLPARGDPRTLLAFDTGPGNALMDAAVELATGGRQSFDRDGEWAQRGRVDTVLLQQLLSHPFFGREPPKSTGRETFGRPMVAAMAHTRNLSDEEGWADLVATLTALTARSIADAVHRWVAPRPVPEMVVTGGGARNATLLSMLREELREVTLLAPDALGIDPDAKEAVAFAALAWAFLRGLPGNAPEATGARGPRVLGSYTPGSVAGASAASGQA